MSQFSSHFKLLLENISIGLISFQFELVKLDFAVRAVVAVSRSCNNFETKEISFKNNFAVNNPNRKTSPVAILDEKNICQPETIRNFQVSGNRWQNFIFLYSGKIQPQTFASYSSTFDDYFVVVAAVVAALKPVFSRSRNNFFFQTVSQTRERVQFFIWDPSQFQIQHRAVAMFRAGGIFFRATSISCWPLRVSFYLASACNYWTMNIILL